MLHILSLQLCLFQSAHTAGSERAAPNLAYIPGPDSTKAERAPFRPGTIFLILEVIQNQESRRDRERCINRFIINYEDIRKILNGVSHFIVININKVVPYVHKYGALWFISSYELIQHNSA